jgi:hypothetical protein
VIVGVSLLGRRISQQYQNATHKPANCRDDIRLTPPKHATRIPGTYLCRIPTKVNGLTQGSLRGRTIAKCLWKRQKQILNHTNKVPPPPMTNAKKGKGSCRRPRGINQIVRIQQASAFKGGVISTMLLRVQNSSNETAQHKLV